VSKPAACPTPDRARHHLEELLKRECLRRELALGHWQRSEHGTRSAEAVAALFGTSASSLRRWRRERQEGKLGSEPRGPKPFQPSSTFLRAILECIEEFVLIGTRALYRALPGIPRVWIEWFCARVRARKARRACQGSLEWTRVGAVWSMDHTELDATIDGEFPFLLVVRDLASGKVLNALPTRSTDHGPVVAELERLFELRGAPLVLKMDNGSGLIHEEVAKRLEGHGVTALRSPPYTPRYNGAIEAGMGSLKHYLKEIAAQQGRPGRPTRDDLEGALLLQAALGGPRGATVPPSEAWRDRTPITAEERRSFLQALAAIRESLLRDSPQAPIVERRAVRTVLTDLKYLVIRRP